MCSYAFGLSEMAVFGMSCFALGIIAVALYFHATRPDA